MNDESLNSIIDSSIKKYTGISNKKLSERILVSLEKRLLSNIDMSKTFEEAKNDFLRMFFTDLLILNFGNVTKIAEIVELDRRNVHRICKKIGMNISEFRNNFRRKQYLDKNVHNVLEDNINYLDINHNSISKKDMNNLYSAISHISQDITNYYKSPTRKELTYDEAILLFEKTFIRLKLEQNDYDKKRVSRLTKIPERTLYRKIKLYALFKN